MAAHTKSTTHPRQISWTGFLFLAWLVLTALFWSLSPGVTEGYSAGLRLLFWAVHVGVPLILLQAAQIWLQSLASVRRLPDTAQVVIAGVSGAALFMPIALILDGIFPDDDPDMPVSWAQQAASELASLVVPVTLVWLGLNAQRLIRIGTADTQGEPVQTSAAKNDAAALLEKLPETVGRDIVSMSAELHYLRVTTNKAEALVLFPFGVAVALFGEDQGMRIHRSHWVAFAHIRGVEKSGDRWTCQMQNGQALPVSRKYRALMKERGISGA